MQMICPKNYGFLFWYFLNETLIVGTHRLNGPYSIIMLMLSLIDEQNNHFFYTIII